MNPTGASHNAKRPRGWPRSLVIAVVFVPVLFAFQVAGAATLSFSIRTPRESVHITDEGGASAVRVERAGYEQTTDPGQPSLPFCVVNVLLPQNHEVTSARFSATGEVVMRTRLDVQKVQPIVEKGLNGSTSTSEDGKIFPSNDGRYLATGFLHGRAIASFVVYPLRMHGDDLHLAETIELEVVTTPAVPSEFVASRERWCAGSDRSTESAIADLVINPGAVAGYVFNTVDVAKPQGGFQPTSYPSLEGSAVDYVIITTADLADEYQVLADWKTAKGVPTVVRTIEWITGNVRQGADLAETIRFFIRDAYAKWGIRYVLLGGDTDIIPTRYALSRYNPPNGETRVPTDLYYGCLDGTWNGDRDADWGEPAEDNPDFYAEVYYGRMPLSDPVEVATIIDRIKRYESAENPAYMDKYLLMAEVLFPYGWDLGDPEPITLNGTYYSEPLRIYMDTTQVRLTRMYETYSLFPGSVPETKAAALDSLNSGFNYVTHIGHGFRQDASVGDRTIKNEDADTLSNDGRWCNLYMLNCTAAAYDYVCLAERFLANPNGGAVSVIGAAESAIPTASSFYMQWYNHFVFEKDVVHIGEAFARSRMARTPFAVGNDGVDAWTHLLYAILAEPEMQLFTTNPDSLVVSHTSSIDLGTHSISVTVTAGGAPVDSARVCLSKDDEDYQTVFTDGAGQAVVDFRAEAPGSISVVTTAFNARRHESFITVGDSPAAYVRISNITIDDDAIGGSNGNGDGIIDAGEVVDFGIELANTGGASASNVSIALTNVEGSAAVIDGVALYGSINPNSTKTTADVIRFEFDTDIPDETALEFLIVVSENATPMWTDGFKKIVHAPVLELTTLRIDDKDFGDGDGIVGSGEDVELFCRIKNFGSGAVYGLTASIEDLGGAFTLISANTFYPYLSAMSAAENTTGFRLMESDTTMEHWLRIVLTDAFGRTVADTVELRPPSAPGMLEFDASLGADRLGIRWESSSSPDVRHYNVYWAPNLFGPFSRLNADPIDHATYLSTGLAPLTTHYFYVRAIDESGNESLPSAVYSAVTNPPQVSGFPVPVDYTSFCSPAVGDLDGDGDNEIVVGADYIYAWHADGSELADGDLDTSTSGVLNAAGYHFDGGITLGALDNVPGLEIIANDIGTESVYIVNRDGAILPGWPRSGEDVFRSTPVLGDLDGDGWDEIIAVDASGVVFVWNRDGSEFIDGDANPSTEGVFFRTPSTTFHYHTPAVCDLDGDGKDEIIVGTRGGLVYALNDDTTAVPGWPFAMPGEMGGAVVAGHIDADPNLEVVVRAAGGEVYLLNHDGTIAPGWPLVIPYTDAYFRPSPALADLDNDGTLDIVLAYYSNTTHEARIYVVDHLGNIRSGWPQTYSEMFSWSSPIVGDVDGDGLFDIVACGDNGYVSGWDRAGTPLAGFPMRAHDAVRGTPVLCDADGDGDEDLVVHSWDQHVYLYDLSGAHDPAAPWPMFQANAKRNGCAGSVVAAAVGGAEFSYSVDRSTVTLTWRMRLADRGAYDVSRARADAGGVRSEAFTQVAKGLALDDQGALRFVDRSVVMGTHYVYQLVSNTDSRDTYTTNAIYIPVAHAALSQNSPNPFNPTTRITYYVPEGGAKPVSLVVYDVSGARVRTLVDDVRIPGRHVVTWDGRDNSGTPVASGIYFCRLVEDSFVATKKMMLLK